MADCIIVLFNCCVAAVVAVGAVGAVVAFRLLMGRYCNVSLMVLKFEMKGRQSYYRFGAFS
jgi:hypothetical protein